MARRILLADDSVTAQNMGRKILTDAGYEVIAVNNGSAALKKIAEQKPDLIVLDVYMPGYSGLEVCQRVKENRETARIPVLLTVGKLEPFKPEEARKARADAFVVKPFEASELLTALTKLEDKIVPQAEPYKPGRFAKAAAAIEEPADSDKFGDADQGWKARLRFPSRKPKASEPVVEPDQATVGGRGARDIAPPDPAPASAPAPAEPPPVNASALFDRPIPAGLPHDITAEEIAAITAAAAQLTGAGSAIFEPPAEPAKIREASASQSTAPIAEPPASIPPATAVREEQQHSELQTSEIAADSTPVVAAPEAAEAARPSHSDDSAPITFASAPGLEAEAKGQAEVSAAPAENLQPEPVSTVESSAAPSSSQVESSVASVEAQPASAEAASPESLAAAAASTIAEPVAAPSEAPAQAQAKETELSAPIAEPAPAAVTPAQEAPAAGASDSTTPQEPVRSEVPPVVASESMPNVPSVAAHDDVMAALQSLIPAPEAGAASSGLRIEPPSSVEGAGDLRYVGSVGPRWIAEEVAVTVEESSASLEGEMQRAYAAFAASEAARLLASSVLETFPGTQPVVPPATTADVAVHASHDSMVAAAGTEPTAQESAETSPSVSLSERSEIAPESLQAMASAAGVGDASFAPSSSPAKAIGEELPQSSTAPSADSSPEDRATVEVASSSPAAQAPAIASGAVSQDSAAHASAYDSSPAGGTDDMGKNSENLGFKMIRQSPAAKSAAKAEPVSKENFEPPLAAPEAEPAVMAAAAATESAPAPIASAPVTAPTDPKAIASIVDSVLAELRPKIVEEIAKKLAGEGKKE